MLILKMQTYISGKMPTKKLKFKNEKMRPSKIRKQFFISTFLGGILSLRQVCFFEISIKFSIFYFFLFQEKKSPLRRADLK
jgi:hypothetical protein